MQSESYKFDVDPDKSEYYLSQEQLDAISFTCDDPEFYVIFRGSDITAQVADNEEEQLP